MKITKETIKKQRQLNRQLDRIIIRQEIGQYKPEKLILTCPDCGATWRIEELEMTSEGFHICPCGGLI